MEFRSMSLLVYPIFIIDYFRLHDFIADSDTFCTVGVLLSFSE